LWYQCKKWWVYDVLRKQKNSITVAFPQQGNVDVENETFTKKLKNSVQRYPSKRKERNAPIAQEKNKHPVPKHPLSQSMQEDANVIRNDLSTEKVWTPRYRKIEEVAGRPIDEILLENLQMKNRNEQMKNQIKRLNNSIEKTNSYLHQLIQVELSLNPDIAVPIANEYGINLQDFSYQENLTNSEALAEGLRKIRYYYHPSVEEWVEVVENAKSNEAYFKTKHEQLKKELHQLQERNQMLEEAEEKRKHKERQILKGGVKIVVNDKKAKPVVASETMVTDTQGYDHVQSIKEEVASHSVEEKETPFVKSSQSKAVQEVQTFLPSTEEIVENQKTNLPTDVPTDVPTTEISPVPASPMLKRDDVAETQISEPLSSKENENESKPSPTEDTKVTYYQASEQDMLKELEKPVYLTLLDKKGYEYETCNKPHFNVVIKREKEEVPLMYIDYTIQKREVFNQIMEKTNQIYLLFDTQHNKKYGNIKFTSWLLKSERNKRDVKFSFTTIDELKASGLDELSHL